VVELPSETHPDQFKAEWDRVMGLIGAYLRSQTEEVNAFNRGDLALVIRDAIQRRRRTLERHAAILRVLNIPLNPRPDAPHIPLPIQRRIVRPLPPATDQLSEWTIRAEDYEHILKVIRHEGRTFEAATRTFRKLTEEELRDVLLAHLNGHYQGEANAEAFRRIGKSDIKIEWQNRAAFVAECKVWKGDETLLGALDQLLGYLLWRDGKTAIVMFNKTVAGFSGIQSKVSHLLKGHRGFVADSPAPAGEWRCMFRLRDDPGRTMTVHTFLFDLFLRADPDASAVAWR
jgi:hypothetical protein